MIEVVKNRIPLRFGFHSLEDIQVLTPMNRGVVGTARLNEALQEALNPNGFEISRGGRKYRIGDKVMQIRNNYDKDVYNGDIGVISSIDAEEQTLMVDWPSNPDSEARQDSARGCRVADKIFEDALCEPLPISEPCEPCAQSIDPKSNKPFELDASQGAPEI